MQRTLVKAARTWCVAMVCLLFGPVDFAVAQQSWPAYVVAEKAFVYHDMSTSSEVLTTLPNGTGVTVYFAVQSIQGSWCKIALKDERQSYGFVLCSQIHRGVAPRPGARAASASECKELVDKLMDATGLSLQFRDVSGDFFSSVSAATTPGLSARVRQDILGILRRDMDGSVLDAAMRRGFINSCDPENYGAVLKTFQEPLATRMVKLESAGPQATANRNYAAKLSANPASAERRALLSKLDRAEGGSQFTVDLVTDMVVTLTTAMSGRTPKQEQIESVRNQMALQMQKNLLSALLVLYHSASDEELRQYISLWESQPVRQFNELFKTVFQEVVETQSRAVGTEVRAYVEANHLQRRGP